MMPSVKFLLGLVFLQSLQAHYWPQICPFRQHQQYLASQYDLTHPHFLDLFLVALYSKLYILPLSANKWEYTQHNRIDGIQHIDWGLLESLPIKRLLGVAAVHACSFLLLLLGGLVNLNELLLLLLEHSSHPLRIAAHTVITVVVPVMQHCTDVLILHLYIHLRGQYHELVVAVDVVLICAHLRMVLAVYFNNIHIPNRCLYPIICWYLALFTIYLYSQILFFNSTDAMQQLEILLIGRSLFLFRNCACFRAVTQGCLWCGCLLRFLILISYIGHNKWREFIAILFCFAVLSYCESQLIHMTKPNIFNTYSISLNRPSIYLNLI